MLSLHEKLTRKGAKIQIAEQYPFQPLHVARQAIVDQGLLGDVTQVTVSISQTYHAASLIRKILGVGFEPATIRATKFESPFIQGPGRAGPPSEEKIVNSQRDIAWIQYNGKLGIYDFTKDQHRSWIRSNHLSIRGVRGEVFDERLSILENYALPLHLDLKRVNKGEQENLEGHYLEGIIAGERWVYRNEWKPGRLYDDEIAVATCLKHMATYASGGPSFYGLPEASQDCYLGFQIEEAIRTGNEVHTERQPWSEA